MTSLATSEIDLRTAEILDADGHIEEDILGIVERLTGKFRELREWQIRAGSINFKVFPPLGFLSSQPTVLEAVLTRRPEEHGKDPTSWEFFLDAVGIRRTVLYPTAGLAVGLVRDLDYAIDLCRAYNDWMAETYLRHPSGKFQAVALLPMQVPHAAAAELRRAVTELGFCAAMLPAHGLPNHLGSALYDPVYETAQELDVALSCHGGVHDGFGFDDFNVFAAAHALGHPFSLLISLGGMLFNGVFDRFPGLRVAYLEGGSAWILLAAERFSESFKAIRPPDTKNILQLKAGSSIRDYLTELMQDGRIVLGCEGGEDHLATAIEYFDCVPFMYSSDFPHEVDVASCEHELEELNELEISDDAKRKLRGDTARVFYRL
jgi:predicted TIM-barrel fold metal-dependent hydrolase